MVLPAWSALTLVLAVCPLIAQPAPLWDDSVRVTLAGSVHPRLARLEPLGPVPPDLPMEKMIFVLKQSPEAKAKANQLLRDQQDPASPSYHQWLTPDQFGAQFGPSKAQLDAAASWLTQQGFTVHGAARGGLSISFSGSAAQVGKAFGTAIVEYDVDGIRRHGNATAISIPQGLTGFTAGVASLNDMPRKHYTVRYAPQARRNPDLAGSGHHPGQRRRRRGFRHHLRPEPAVPRHHRQRGHHRGGGETNITLSDQTSFVTNFGLNTYNGSFAVVTPSGVDPGILQDGEEIEADVDTQWSAAAAPGADIRLVLFPSTLTTQGADLSPSTSWTTNTRPS